MMIGKWMFRRVYLKRSRIRLLLVACIALLIVNICINYVNILCTTTRYFSNDYPLENFNKMRFRWPTDLNRLEIQHILDGGVIRSRRVYSDFDFSSVITPRKNCEIAQNNNNADILFLIKSSPSHFDFRTAIRNSWGDEETHPFIRRVFLVGLNKELDVQLRDESIHYDDILQFKFIDTYYNNTLKLTNGISWASKRCKNVKFVVAVDDDYFVATNRLMEYLESIPSTSRKHLYLGQRHSSCESLAVRYPFDKWYISYRDYPYINYPPFIVAGTIIMTPDFVRDVTKLLPYTQPIAFDDVYLGFVAHKLNISVVNTKLISNKKMSMDDPKFHTMLAVHGYTPYELLQYSKKKDL